MSAGKIASEVFRSRQSFAIEKAKLNFFPGHMNRGMRKMQARLSRVDCFLEIHDARIPFSGRNPNFYTKLTAIRPHILVFNKMDLVKRDGEWNSACMIMKSCGFNQWRYGCSRISALLLAVLLDLLLPACCSYALALASFFPFCMICLKLCCTFLFVSPFPHSDPLPIYFLIPNQGRGEGGDSAI